MIKFPIDKNRGPLVVREILLSSEPSYVYFCISSKHTREQDRLFLLIAITRNSRYLIEQNNTAYCLPIDKNSLSWFNLTDSFHNGHYIIISIKTNLIGTYSCVLTQLSVQCIVYSNLYFNQMVYFQIIPLQNTL